MTNTPPFLVSPLLDENSIAHGFFTRLGGVSAAPYDSLNTGPGSADDAASVAENRARCTHALGAEALLTGYQTHSADVLFVEKPWDGAPPKVDGLVSKTPGLALGVLAADCMPFLFMDARAGVIGAAHAGWRGALAGVLENTVAAMTRLGSKPDNMRVAVGPCLRQSNFEVGLELVEAFTAKHRGADQFFAAGKNEMKRQLDLVGFGCWRLAECGVRQIDDIGLCTLDAPERFFSYRAAKRDGLAGFGRNLSAIALKHK